MSILDTPHNKIKDFVALFFSINLDYSHAVARLRTEKLTNNVFERGGSRK